SHCSPRPKGQPLEYKGAISADGSAVAEKHIAHWRRHASSNLHLRDITVLADYESSVPATLRPLQGSENTVGEHYDRVGGGVKRSRDRTAAREHQRPGLNVDISGRVQRPLNVNFRYPHHATRAHRQQARVVDGRKAERVAPGAEAGHVERTAGLDVD